RAQDREPARYRPASRRRSGDRGSLTWRSSRAAGNGCVQSTHTVSTKKAIALKMFLAAESESSMVKLKLVPPAAQEAAPPRRVRAAKARRVTQKSEQTRLLILEA